MKKIIILFFIISTLCVSNTFAVEKIDINSANLSQLQDIIHVGEKLAPKIIAGRPYNSVQDLSKIKGIGNGKYLQDIINQGLACVDCAITSLVIPSLTGNPVINTENMQDTLDSRLRGNDTTETPPLSPIIYPSGIIFNEILPSPEGSDEENEFIELYNKNNFDVDLSGWKIKDQEGTNTTFIIPKNTKILANNFLVFKRPQTNISLNNASDTLNLILPNNKIIDSVSFTKAPINQSYNKTDSSWFWSANLTPYKQNIILQISLNNSKTSLLKTDNSDNSIIEADKLLASLSDKQNIIENITEDNNNPWLLFLLVLAVTIILSITILFLKIKFNF